MDERRAGPAGPDDIIIAVTDPELEQEAATVIAATGRRAVHVTSPDPGDAAWRRCAAVLVDEERAGRMLADAPAARWRRDGLHVVCRDDADPPEDLAAELGCGPPVALPSCGADLVGWIGRPGSPASGRVIAWLPAVGGAGASVAAAACAVAVARTHPTVLVDADGYSGGADLLLGAEAEPGVRWPDVRAEAGALDGGALFGAVPVARGRGAGHAGSGPGILTGPRSRADDGWEISPRAVSAVVDAIVGAGGVAVVDLPGAGAVAEAVAPRADVLAVVVPATVRGLAAATRHAAALRRVGGDPVAVVRWPAPGGVTVEDIRFATGLEVVGELPTIRGLPREIEADGLGRSAARIARGLGAIIGAGAAGGRA